MKTKKISLFLLSGFLTVSFLGCAEQQPVKPVTKTIKKPITKIYTPSVNEKKAIAILIYKQKELEEKLNKLNQTKSEKKVSLDKSQSLKSGIGKSALSPSFAKTNKCDFSKQKPIRFCDTKIDNNTNYIAISNVNIRRCATIHSPIVGKVKKGEKVHFLDCNKYCWCFLSDKRGYVNRNFFKSSIQKNNNNNAKNSKSNQDKQNIIKDKIATTSKNVNNKNNQPLKALNADKIIKNYINSK